MHVWQPKRCHDSIRFRWCFTSHRAAVFDEYCNRLGIELNTFAFLCYDGRLSHRVLLTLLTASLFANIRVCRPMSL